MVDGRFCAYIKLSEDGRKLWESTGPLRDSEAEATSDLHQGAFELIADAKKHGGVVTIQKGPDIQ